MIEHFGKQFFSNSRRAMSDLYEYHDYLAHGVIEDEKITGFCYITWDIDFSAVYTPLTHILVGIADQEYRHNSNLECCVPTVKYGVDFRCRNNKIEHAYLYPDTENILLISRDSNNRITFVGEQTNGTRHGFGVEITYTDTKDTLLYGIWEAGTLKYQYKDKNWVEVE